RGAELAEIGVLETRLEMREYLADFDTVFHDVRAAGRAYAKLHDPADYSASRALPSDLLRAGSNGIAYRSVRHPGGESLASFGRPEIGSWVAARAAMIAAPAAASGSAGLRGGRPSTSQRTYIHTRLSAPPP